MVWVILLCLLVLLLFYHTLEDLYMTYIRHCPPGPLSLPLIGGIHHLHPTRPHLSVKDLADKYGPIFSLRMGTAGRAVFLQDIHLIDKVFASTTMNDRPPMAMFDIISPNANGIGSCPYGDHWTRMTKEFQRGISKLSQRSLKDKANHAYQQLMEKFSANTDNLKPEIMKACSAIFSSVVYGIPLESLDSSELQSRIQYHTCIQDCLHPAHPINVCPPLWYLPLPYKDQIRSCIKERDVMMKQNLDHHMQQCTDDVTDIMDIAANFMQKQERKTKQTYHTPPEDIQQEDMLISMWTIYLAGCDTIVEECLWITLYMSVNTDIQQKVQAEVDQVLSMESNNSLEQKHNLHYTRAVILECIRMSSITGMGIPHFNTEEVQLGEFTIPKGTIIFPSQYYIHHDEKLWPDPFTLNPDRFLDSCGQVLSTTQLNTMPFIPFSRGKRSCLGKYMALDLLLVYTTTLLQRFTLKLPEGCKPDLRGKVGFCLAAPETPIIFTAR